MLTASLVFLELLELAFLRPPHCLHGHPVSGETPQNPMSHHEGLGTALQRSRETETTGLVGDGQTPRRGQHQSVMADTSLRC
jgi:hypothetical protein